MMLQKKGRPKHHDESQKEVLSLRGNKRRETRSYAVKLSCVVHTAFKMCFVLSDNIRYFVPYTSVSRRTSHQRMATFLQQE